MSKFSTFFVIRFFLFIILAVYLGGLQSTEARADAISFRLLLDRSEVLSGGFKEDYLQGLLETLIQGAENGSRLEGVRVHLIRDRNVIAQTFSSADIVISTGLIAALQSEAELAFVLGHEVGHLALGHFSHQRKSSEELELEADSYGLNLLVRASYIPHASIDAIRRAYSKTDLVQGKGYPQVAQRIDALKPKISRMPANRFARTSRRDFVKLQYLLKE